MKVIINVVGGQVQEVHADTKEIDVVLVDFDQNDSELLSAKYMEEVLENSEMFHIPLQEMKYDEPFEPGDANIPVQCCICQVNEDIDLNNTGWMPEIWVKDDSLGPICPDCQSKWATIPPDEEPFIDLTKIPISRISEIPGLMQYLQLDPPVAEKPLTFGELLKQQSDQLEEQQAKVTWLRAFYNNMIELLNAHGYTDSSYCFEFHESLHGEPAIIKVGGEYELLGTDLCVDLDNNNYLSILEPDREYFAEPENNECLRCYKA